MTTSEVTTKLGRVQLVAGTPPMLPAKCVICGTSGDSSSEFIDTGWDIDFYGVVYFCKNCIKEAAAVLSMISVEKYNQLLDDYNELDYKYAGLLADHERLRDVVSNLHSLGFGVNHSGSESNSSESSVDAPTETTKSSSGKSSSAKSRSAKSSDESGSTDVRVNDGSKNPGLPDL